MGTVSYIPPDSFEAQDLWQAVINLSQPDSFCIADQKASAKTNRATNSNNAEWIDSLQWQ